jgi:hypothetical protein
VLREIGDTTIFSSSVSLMQVSVISGVLPLGLGVRVRVVSGRVVAELFGVPTARTVREGVAVTVAYDGLLVEGGTQRLTRVIRIRVDSFASIEALMELAPSSEALSFGLFVLEEPDLASEDGFFELVEPQPADAIGLLELAEVSSVSFVGLLELAEVVSAFADGLFELASNEPSFEVGLFELASEAVIYAVYPNPIPYDTDVQLEVYGYGIDPLNSRLQITFDEGDTWRDYSLFRVREQGSDRLFALIRKGEVPHRTLPIGVRIKTIT